MNFNSDEIKKRYSLVREEINYKYSIIDIVKKYDPNINNYSNKICSILSDTDSTPSFYVNYEKRVWKDFSTGKGGGYLELLYWTKKLVEHEEVDIRSLANGILIKDVDMQKKLQLKSIFKETNTGSININLRNKTPKIVTVNSFGKILKELSHRENKDLLIDFIGDYQMGTPINELISKYSVYGDVICSKDDKKELEDLISSILNS